MSTIFIVLVVVLVAAAAAYWWFFMRGQGQGGEKKQVDMSEGDSAQKPQMDMGGEKTSVPGGQQRGEQAERSQDQGGQQ